MVISDARVLISRVFLLIIIDSGSESDTLATTKSVDVSKKSSNKLISEICRNTGVLPLAKARAIASQRSLPSLPA